jgi:hypothetical protein
MIVVVEECDMRILFILLTVSCLVGCEMSKTPEPGPEVVNHGAQLMKTDYDTVPYEYPNLLDYAHFAVTDPTGVHLFTYNGVNYYHPVMTGFEIIQCLQNYRATGETRFLAYAEHVAEVMLARAKRMEGSIYFPYEFDFALHGDTNYMMYAPWWSGMAQGVELSVYTRLYHETHNAHYKRVADSILVGLYNYNSVTRVAYISTPDELVQTSNYYWVDEYPQTELMYTLNGFIFAMYGLYDYWREFHDDQAASLFSNACATIEDHIALFRVPGGISYYDLKFRKQLPSYHKLHIAQLRMLTLLTGDPFFSQTADVFYSDYHTGYRADVEGDFPDDYLP